jgi:acetolactate synthase-1/2/3 large subunit
MEEYFSYDNVVFLEVMMDPEQDFIPKVKGVPVAESTEIFSPPLEEMSPLLSLEIIQNIMGEQISNKSRLINRD